MIIDYEDLNIEIKNIIGENLNITGQYQNEFSDVLDFENDIKVFYSATEILINIFNYERDIVLFENKELVKNLIIINDIQQILKDDIPNLIKICYNAFMKKLWRINK